MADAKTREKEDTLALKELEFDRKLKAIEDRILYKRGKNDEREVFEVKREHAIELETLMDKMEQVKEELDYQKTKVAKLENTNKELRMSKDPSAVVTKQQETTIEYL